MSIIDEKDGNKLDDLFNIKILFLKRKKNKNDKYSSEFAFLEVNMIMKMLIFSIQV